MQVTSENFEQVLPLLEDSIKRADFIAIDAEFTGKLAQLEGKDLYLLFDISDEQLFYIYDVCLCVLRVQRWTGGQPQRLRYSG